MAQDVSEAIRATVLSHYAETDDVLLLSELGKMLRVKGHWPPPDDQRPLVKIVEELDPEIILRRDPHASAYVAVVPAAKEHLVTEAIERRRRTHLLSKLPRPILLAFCLRQGEGQPIYVRPAPPFRYHIGESPGSDFVPIEDCFRSPGLYIDDVDALSPGDAIDLVGKIEGWASQHGIRLEQFSADRRGGWPVPAAGSQPPRATTNALERLYEAQPPNLREQIVMPFDIAVYLSRMP